MNNVVSLVGKTVRATTNSEVATALRVLADAVEAGQWGEVRHVLSIVDRDDCNVGYTCTGERLDTAHMLGLLRLCEHEALTP